LAFWAYPSEFVLSPRFLRTAFFLVLGLAFAQPIFAQTWEVVGNVLDDQRGEPLSGVEVLDSYGKSLGKTNATGRFEITVNNRRSIITFRKKSFREFQVDLGEVPELIGVDFTMESEVQELEEKTTVALRGGRDPSAAQTMEELELMQGMRMDLQEHLRQMHGVSGMTEFSNDISVHGSRTRDVTHYLGRSRIPSLRHLDFGFPGNQSVLNPRLLRAVTLSDNPAKGPLNQGNASALVYDLKEGDPENILGDVVFGTINRELNLNGYWNGRTYVFSGRYLAPTFLANMGEKFFTNPKESRLNSGGALLRVGSVIRDGGSSSGELKAAILHRTKNGRHDQVPVLAVLAFPPTHHRTGGPGCGGRARRGLRPPSRQVRRDGTPEEPAAPKPGEAPSGRALSRAVPEGAPPTPRAGCSSPSPLRCRR
jgi:hypothetical protein